MRRQIARTLALTWCIAVAGCNGASQQTGKTPADGRGKAGPAFGASDLPEKHDVSPVAEPGTLVFHARWKAPGDSLATLGKLAGIDRSLIETNERLLVRELLNEAAGSNVASNELVELVDLKAPVDLAIVADSARGGPLPDPLIGFSVGLKSLERARQSIHVGLTKIASGVWRVGGERRLGESCALAAAAGKAPARLVCVERGRYLDKLAPYMARNVATLPDKGSDIHMELNLRSVLDKHGRTWARQARGLPVFAEEFKLGVPKFDAALIEAATALAGEAGMLIQDAKSATVDIDLDDERGAKAQLRFDFAGQRSWVAQGVVEASKKSGPAPDAFWKLPLSSSTAGYGSIPDTGRYDKILAAARDMLEGWLTKEKVATPADRQAVAKLLRLPFSKGVPFVYADGAFAPPARDKTPTIAALVDAMVGWHVIGIGEKPDKIKGYLEEVVRSYNRGTLQQHLKKEAGADAKHMPRVKKIGAPRELGGGAMVIEITVPEVEEPGSKPAIEPPAVEAPGRGRRSERPAPKAKTTDAKVVIMLMADGDQTWLGVAADAAKLAKLMAGLKREPGSESLSSRSGLSRLRSESHASVGVTSFGGIANLMRPSLSWFMTIEPGGAGMEEQRAILEALDRLPNKGATPVVMAADAQGKPPSAVVTIDVPREALADLGSFLTSMLKTRDR
jgi:hypothetical protein